MLLVPGKRRFVSPPVFLHNWFIHGGQQILKPIIGSICHSLKCVGSGTSADEEPRQLIDLESLREGTNGQLLGSLVGIAAGFLGYFKSVAWPNDILCRTRLANRCDRQHTCRHAKRKATSVYCCTSLTIDPKTS